MIIVSLIVSSLALLAAVTNIILFFAEKKRSDRRHSLMVDFVNAECESACRGAVARAEEITKITVEESSHNILNEMDSVHRKISRRFEKGEAEIENLKSGIIPDYERALAAANAVNDFNNGIVGILNFDPIAAARKQRLGEDREAE